ncbi:hypothetical protein ACT3RO_09135 [Psychrobacter sp. AOP5-CZ1-12]|uniref:hypothetical protein n=1 Tax=Psychrobacter sp. AOP5-CZ1-12 TaxID=3457651 RepID=UPI00402BA461
MNLSAKTIRFKNITKIDLHPLAKKLYELMIEAYVAGGQEEYLKLISDRFDCYPSGVFQGSCHHQAKLSGL